MKKVLYSVVGVFVGALVCFCVVYFCLHQRESNQCVDSRLKVGCLIAKTGFGADFGDAESMAVELLRSEFGETVSFVIEDNKSNVRDGILACQKLLNVDKVDMIYCDLTMVVNAVSPLVRRKRKVLIAAVCLKGLLEENDLTSLGKKTICLVGSNDEFGRGALEEIIPLADSFRCHILSQEWIPDDVGLIRSLATKILLKAPEGVYIASLSSNMGTLIRELRSQNYKGEILSTDATSYEYIRMNMGNSFKTVTYVDFPETKARMKLNQRAQQRWHKDMQPAGLILYDGIRFVISKLYVPSQQGGALAVCINNEMKFEGVFGETVFTGRAIEYPLSLIKGLPQ